MFEFLQCLDILLGSGICSLKVCKDKATRIRIFSLIICSKHLNQILKPVLVHVKLASNFIELLLKRLPHVEVLR